MATQLTQSDLDTLYAAARDTAATPTGPYNPVGTSTGEFAANRLSSAFERNVATIIALTEFLVASTEDPTASATKAQEARRQKKLLKDMLAKASMRVQAKANNLTDDRVAFANRVTDKMIVAFNSANRPDALVS